MTGWRHPHPADTLRIVELALQEDHGPGDLTRACFAPEQTVRAYLEAQAPGVICGVGLAHDLFGSEASVQVLVSDGSSVTDGTILAHIEGPADFVLGRERIALNFLMTLSGTASLTRKFVEAIHGTSATIVDTRKTLPGLRSLQKYAVRCGGGTNHRLGLYDAAMIKDNHIAASGSIGMAVQAIRASAPHTATIEVECESEEQVDEAIAAGANIVMLDNMPPAEMERIVSARKGQVVFEASGGVNLDTVRAIAESGVDLISVGALTHSAPGLPIHLEVS